ncbi:unnamed protein product [Oikopleura dioica]|uniref:Uncharacterized protein n=1 Tax=Oikopleura dioica TaxID=34765 RepID=E4XV44_OIKDI|nr:unnamed protein product [Oikopleura dioica]
MRFLLIIFINLAQAALRQRETCNDQEINNECLVVCDGEFFECTKNCENSECSRKCFEELDVCENSCPCGADCPTGCVDCPEHPLCEDECEDAQLNNEEYQICLNEAIYELDFCLKTCPPEIGCHDSCYENYTQMLFLCPCIEQETTTTTEISTTTTEIMPIEPCDVFILVIPRVLDESYLQSGDGSSQISATINAPDNDYARYASHALVNGKLHIFGGNSDVTKIARLDDCTLNELTVRLNEGRNSGHAALSIENGKKALICFGNYYGNQKTCDIFDGSTTVSSFSADSTHYHGGLGLYKNQPASVGCYDEEHQKAETLSASGWTALPDHPKRISVHSLVGLENQSMLLIGGQDWGNDGAYQSGIWQLKEKIGIKSANFCRPTIKDLPFTSDICLKTCTPDIDCHNSCYARYSQQLFLCPCFGKETTTTTTDVSTVTMTTTDLTPIEPSDVFILVIPYYVDESYLQSGDGISQISATINAPENNYADNAAHALVNGKLHIFGGYYDGTKIARLDDCTLNELPVRLNEERNRGHAALSIENGKKALICFGPSGDNRKTCEIFDGSTTVSTFAADSTHKYGGLGLYKNQPASVGCWSEKHQKAEMLSSTGWIALPDHPKLIYYHSLVGLENQSLLLIGGRDYGNGGAAQSGIWRLKNENWNKIGDLLQADYEGSAIYIGRSIYYFGYNSPFAIQRLDLNETEDLQNVSRIGNQPSQYFLPVLFKTVSDYCI